jgi:hypothetical protein
MSVEPQVFGRALRQVMESQLYSLFTRKKREDCERQGASPVNSPY